MTGGCACGGSVRLDDAPCVVASRVPGRVCRTSRATGGRDEGFCRTNVPSFRHFRSPFDAFANAFDVTRRGLLAAVVKQGIAFRGHSIPELQKVLPKVDKEPLPEGLLWLLLTGEVPTPAEAESVRVELFKRAKLPAGVKKVINSLPKDMHPMTQLSIATLAMQKHSKFAKAYQEGLRKAEYWKYTFEDALDLIARLPEVAAIIYRRSFHDGVVAPHDKVHN